MKTFTRRLAIRNGSGFCIRRPYVTPLAARRLRLKVHTGSTPTRHTTLAWRKAHRFGVPKLQAKLQSDAPSDSLVRDALKQINNYCERLPPESVAAIECWDAYNYFANEAVAAEQQCDIESPSGGFQGQACNNFLQWESFVRQVEASGGVKEMVRTILALKNAKSSEPTELRKAKKSSIIPIGSAFDEDETRRLCKKLFDRKDKDKDGRINVEEFRSLMRILGDEVHGETISVMFEALDIHGSLDFDEFFTILEAESIRSHSAGFLRATQKHGHYGDRPKWLDNL